MDISHCWCCSVVSWKNNSSRDNSSILRRYPILHPWAVLSTSVGGRRFCQLLLCDLPATWLKFLEKLHIIILKILLLLFQIHRLLKETTRLEDEICFFPSELKAWWLSYIIAHPKTTQILSFSWGFSLKKNGILHTLKFHLHTLSWHFCL